MVKFVKILKIMKKIIFSIIIGLLLISCRASGQYSMLSTLYQNYNLYHTYLTQGSYVKAELSGRKLLQGESLFGNYLAGSLTGRSGLMDSCLTAFNTLYGKTHSPLTFQLTAVSYLDLDSLFLNGVKVSNIYPKDSILSWIGTAGLDTLAVESLISANSIDSTFLNSHLQIFRDSLDVTEDVKDSVLFWISDSVLSQSQIISLIQSYSIQTDAVLIHIDNLLDTLDYTTSDELTAAINGIDSGSDSSWVSTITDTAHVGTIVLDDAQGSQIITDAGGLIITKHVTTGYSIVYDLATGYVYGTHPLSNDLELRFFTTPSGTAPTIIPKRNDSNTGYSWSDTDKLALVAGGQSVLTAEYTSSKSVVKEIDSLVVGTVDATDVYADIIHTSNGDHINLVSFDNIPADSALIGLTSNGTTFYYDYGGLDLNVTGTPKNNTLTFFTDSNTIAGTTIEYSPGTLKFNTGADTGILFTQTTGSYPSIMGNNSSSTAAIKLTTTGYANGIESSVTGGAVQSAFYGTVGARQGAGFRTDVGNYEYTMGLRITNSSTYNSSYSIYVNQSSNYPYIFYCANKFKIDGYGTPFIRDTSLYAWVSAHGGGGSGSGNVVSITTDVAGYIPFYIANDTIETEAGFSYSKSLNLLSVPSISCTNFNAYANSTATVSEVAGYNKALTIYRANSSQTGTLSNPILELSNFSGGTAITTGPVLFIDDKPTSTGTKLYKLFQADVDDATMISFYPRATDITSAVAYSFNTSNNLTSDRRVFEIKNYGVDKFTVLNDTVIAHKCFKSIDSLYLPYATSGAERWIGLSRQGAVFSDSLVNAGFMLTMDIPTIKEHLEDQENGEIAWYYKDAKGDIHKSYGIANIGRITYQVQALMSAQEQSFRYINELEDRVAKLEKLLSVEPEKRIKKKHKLSLKNLFRKN